jgi:hypothetical protein
MRLVFKRRPYFHPILGRVHTNLTVLPTRDSSGSPVFDATRPVGLGYSDTPGWGASLTNQLPFRPSWLWEPGMLVLHSRTPWLTLHSRPLFKRPPGYLRACSGSSMEVPY